MTPLDIVHQTNGTFTQIFVLDKWCDLIDFSTGHWHAMLRKTVTSSVAHYEWSTENGNLTYAQTFAHGEIEFTSNPSIGATLLFGSAVVEFGATDGVAIELDLHGTMANLLAYLNASTDADLLRCVYSITYTTDGATLSLIYKTTGSLGNTFPIDHTTPGATASGEVLSGGGGVLTLTAPVEDVSAFTGEYVYDVRFQTEDEMLMVPIVGGMITFEQGVTRDVQEELPT